jgi:acetylornithine/succinyldiaminopimelate/putrescine aminotransferase
MNTLKHIQKVSVQGNKIVSKKLKRNYSVNFDEVGLKKSLLAPFLEKDQRLKKALKTAEKVKKEIMSEFGMTLEELVKSDPFKLLDGFVNFYHPDTVNRYVAVAANGPWIVTAKGGVLYDVGGYGMLGFGHNDPDIAAALAKDQCMANVMTPSFSHLRFIKTIRKEVGHARKGHPEVYEKFMCLNSGSESVGLAGRLADSHAHLMTKKGGKHEGKTPCLLTIEGSFHGRVTYAANLSESCHEVYEKNLSSFQGKRRPHVFVVRMNDVNQLKATYKEILDKGFFVEMFAVEPVMGEGIPGLGISREFYDVARKLTKESDSLLLVDSIQAGLRSTGALSIVDYPGFETADIPDFETFSKALNGGQFPLSVLALGPRAKGLYKQGTYGNTMTGNPRGMDVATEILRKITPEIRQNIKKQGKALLGGLIDLQKSYPGIITGCEGNGLLLAANIDPKYPVNADRGVEQMCRHAGLNIIHCGDNALRFTPQFDINEAEVKLCLQIVEDCLVQLKN